MNWKSAEQVAESYAQSMGAELGAVFHALSTELTWVHWRWQQYRILFGDKESRLDMLNDAAPFFFRVVQDVFFDDTLLGIARLAGPPQTIGKQNLAITRLPLLIKDSLLQAEVTDLVLSAKATADFAFDWRNRHIAHRDLSLALSQKVKPLKAASRQHVEGALKALRAVMNRVEAAYCDATTAYESSPTVEDAESLLYVIRDGLRMEQARRERWDHGELHDDDVNPPEPV